MRDKGDKGDKTFNMLQFQRKTEGPIVPQPAFGWGTRGTKQGTESVPLVPQALLRRGTEKDGRIQWCPPCPRCPPWKNVEAKMSRKFARVLAASTPTATMRSIAGCSPRLMPARKLISLRGPLEDRPGAAAGGDETRRGRRRGVSGCPRLQAPLLAPPSRAPSGPAEPPTGWCRDTRDDFEERAAIVQFEGRLSRREAECLAREAVVTQEETSWAK